MTYKAMLRIDTPSQDWAEEKGACRSGRRRLGKLSIAEYFRTSNNSADLQWIAKRLRPAVVIYDQSYVAAIERLYAHGRWAAKRMREQIQVLFVRYDVTIPARLL